MKYGLKILNTELAKEREDLEFYAGHMDSDDEITAKWAEHNHRGCIHRIEVIMDTISFLERAVKIMEDSKLNTSENLRPNYYHSLSEEQTEELKEFATTSEINFFLTRLNTNYGDGEVLNYQHILNVFQKGFHSLIPHESIHDALTYYVDCKRMVAFSNGNIRELLNINTFDELVDLHDKLSISVKPKADAKIEKMYLGAMEPFEHLKEYSDDSGFRFELIATPEELQNEGDSMNHCIATYLYIVAREQYIGFRVYNDETGERLTLGCIREGNRLAFNQLKGHSNSPASRTSCMAAIDFCHANNIEVNPLSSIDLAIPLNLIQ